MAGAQPLLCEKAFVRQLLAACEAVRCNGGWRDQQVDLAPLFAAWTGKHEINLRLMEKAALRKVAQQKKERKKKKKLSLAFRFARHTCRTATGDARGNLRVMQGQEMRRGRDTWKKATRQFFWGQQMDWDFISISGFKPPQFERMMALGHICMWSASYTTQGAWMPWGWELSKYLIGKISSMYIRQRKLLWNKYFPQSVKTRASEDFNSSIGTDGLTNTFSLPPQTTHTFSFWRLIQKCDACLVILLSHSPHSSL